VAVWSYRQFHQLRRRLVLFQHAAKNGLEVLAELDGSQVAGSVLANLFRLSNGVVDHFEG
jgi:hypothetical protein